MLRPLVIGLVAGVLLLSGCASVVNGNRQKVSVTTHDKGVDVSGATCTLSNDKGVWYLTSPGSTSVHRSYGDMKIDCALTGTTNGSVAVPSVTTGAVYGNILIGGGIGAGVDIATGAAFRYPDVVRVEMGRRTVFPGTQPDMTGTTAPAEAPPADSALAVADVPYLNDAQLAQYRLFLTRPLPRAFAIAPNGHFASAWTTKPFDKTLPSDPRERVLVMCGRGSGLNCTLFAVDNRLVATTPVSAATTAATVEHTHRGKYPADPALASIRVPALNDGQQAEYQAFLTHPVPRAFAVSGDGHFSMAWSTSSPDASLPDDPSQRALAVCRRQAGRACRLFVVDDRLVAETP